MFHDKRWICGFADRKKTEWLAGALDVSQALAAILISRGMDSVQDAKKFLYPRLDSVIDPFMMPDMRVSVERIIRALKHKERICIYGDYDVDGITSVAVMLKVLEAAGGDLFFYIPSRFEEGYGLNQDAIRNIHARGARLLVTVDCGITSFKEVELCNELGMDVIVTDHHQCQRQLPPALGVINPKRGDSPYPFAELAGVGVAYKLCAALETMMGEARVADGLLDLVALGTVADIVPLNGENRVLVYEGLKKMINTANPGIRALKKVSGIADGHINTGQIAFGLAPRLNAVGRLAAANRGVQLLTTDDDKEADVLAKEMDVHNRERQAVENQILEQAVEMAEKRIDDSIFVLASDKWHPGVIGIVASRIVERYNRPAVLLNIDGDEARGSARSIPGLDLYRLLSSCRHFYKKFGGHRQAAGLTLGMDNFEDFARQINNEAKRVIEAMDDRPIIRADVDLTGTAISIQEAQDLKLMEPCGYGNPSPLFVKRNVRVTKIKRVGKKGEHLKLTVNERSTPYDCIAFGWQQLEPPIRHSEQDIAFSPGINHWLGKDSLQLVIKDIRNIRHRSAFLKEWYDSIEDLESKGSFALVSGREPPCGVTVQRVGDRFSYMIELFNKSSGNVLVVNGFYDVSDVISILSMYPDTGISFGKLEDYSTEGNYIIVNPYSLEGLECCTGRLCFFGHCILPVQLEALEKLQELKPALIVEGNCRCISEELRELIPDRKELAGAYRWIKMKKTIPYDTAIMQLIYRGISPATAVLVLESFVSTRLIGVDDGKLFLLPVPKTKVDIFKAQPIQRILNFARAVQSCYDAIKVSNFDV